MSDAERPSGGDTGLPEPNIDAPEFDEDGDEGEIVDLDPPDVKTARFPTWKLRKHHKKRRKKAKDGYVKWFLIDGTWPEPKYVKPSRTGDGIPIVRHDGQPYLFPESAMLASKLDGMWTMCHKKGSADPINLREPSRNAIPADALDEYLTMSVQTDAPSFWDKINVSGEEAVMYAIAGIILIAVLSQVSPL